MQSQFPHIYVKGNLNQMNTSLRRHALFPCCATIVWIQGLHQLIGPGLAMYFGDNAAARQMGLSRVKAKYQHVLYIFQ